MAKKIVLDAGHAYGTAGNKTPDGIYEWTLNNKVALAVAKNLADYEVTIQRIDDVTGKTDVSLAERVSRTNKIMPDAFVSIHHNAYNSKWGNHSGVEVFYNLNRKNDTEKKIATDMAVAKSANTGIMNRGAKTAAFYVLTCDPRILAVLAEGGFMDSTIDHPIITSTKGQEAYGKAISDTLIKHLKLVKKAKPEAEVKPTVTTPIKIGDPYPLKTNTTGYYTAADAAANRDWRVNVQAGEYWVFNVANGMLNITKTKGYPGSWINPETATGTTPAAPSTPTQPTVIGGKYTLKNNTPGFYTASDAKENRNQRVTVLAGDYTIFNIINGMINITKIVGKPGSWINPEINANTTVPNQPTPTIGKKYNLEHHTPGYYTAADAQAKRNQRVTVLSGEYVIFNVSSSMINLTKVAGQPGSWINPL